MNKIEYIKTAMHNLENETYIFESSMFNELEEDKVVTFGRFFEVDDTLQVYRDCEDYLDEIDSVFDAENALRMRVSNQCARSDYSIDGYRPEDF